MGDRDKVWKEVKADSSKISALVSSVLLLDPKIAQILVTRGIDTVEKAAEFICGGVEYLHNPFLFSDMLKAVERLRRALEDKELILVYGDRDVDGVTSVNIIVDTIRRFGGNIEWYVPAGEGYGLNKEIISNYASKGAKVLITVDCGISSNEEIGYAGTLGIDVVITDHHKLPSECCPNAYAIINPKMTDSNYPFEHISGCVVALKLAQALTFSFFEEYNKNIVLYCSQASGTTYISIKNGLEIKKFDIKPMHNSKDDIIKAFRIYVNSSEIKDFLIKKNDVLKDKIFVIGSQVKNINDLKKAYKKKITDENIIKDFYKRTLDLCALATIADSMPLNDENRIVVKEGLKIIKDNPHARHGLGFLIDSVFNMQDLENITAKSVSWNITPVINSSGRMHKGKLSVELLMTKDISRAKELHSEILKLNENRRYLQYENIKQFKHLLKEQCDTEKDKVLIVKAAHLDHGVTSIVASQMVKAYGKPVFLFISDGKEASGAVRSVEGFDVVAALDSVKDILIKYGGHSQAAGFTFEDSKSSEFIKRIYEYADKNLKTTSLSNTLLIENELKISDITVDCYKQVEIMQPFGVGNLAPVFSIKKVTTTEVSKFGTKNEHLKFKVSQKGSKNVPAVFWHKSKFAGFVQSESLLDIAFNIEMAKKNGSETAYICVLDIKPSY
ncbi:MAG: single-stranded-DNA-specific exonuclease RecJ [Endomicrobium sp.]|jgi:single-stranded-DNA-specific exonuclease|nr:single-stranded-DNA-specific exonuclease RecJ [Endomicrobium sp.]